MEEPPHADGRCKKDESEGLVAAEGVALGFAPFFSGYLLVMWLDAGLNHAFTGRDA